jgi:hypothetical protein
MERVKGCSYIEEFKYRQPEYFWLVIKYRKKSLVTVSEMKWKTIYIKKVKLCPNSWLPSPGRPSTSPCPIPYSWIPTLAKRQCLWGCFS